MIAGRHMIERMRTDRTWLSPPDPSTNQRFLSRCQHQGTATWFFEGDTYTEWKSKSTAPLLWIHGKRAPFLVFPVSSQILTALNYYSGFGEERPLVRCHLSCSPLRNLHLQLALQSSKT